MKELVFFKNKIMKRLPNAIVGRQNYKVTVGRRSRMELDLLHSNSGVAREQLLVNVRGPKNGKYHG